ncbi:uncharacterized protein [Haliotis asinina]|uniref:uncharacterized protein n=1 Tax=Haliotis asinina TaxID=109174 RepID=UPI0035326ADB
MEKSLLFLVLFVSLFGSCLSIRCHQCAMVGGDDCGDYYNGEANSDNIDDCGDKDTHCVKFKTKVWIGDSGYINGRMRESVVVTRGCTREPGYGDGCEGTQAAGGLVIKCRCSTDGCNSANSMYSFTTLMTTVLLTVVVAALNMR